MELKKIKQVKPNRHLFRKVIAILVSIGVIVGSYFIITEANEAASDTVEVLRIKSKEGFTANTAISKDDIESYDIIRKEFDEDMVEADEIDSLIDTYSIYFIRGESIIYEDMFTEDKPQKNEWLYELEDDYEVLTLPYNYLECGGDILMPGDKVRIRVSYTTEETTSVNDGNPNVSRSGKEVTKVEVLFDSIIVKDMLNSNSHSIYEVYKEVMKLSEDKKQSVMKSDEFLKNIQPKSLLLEGSGDQIERYAMYKGLGSNSFLITILSRDENSVVLDQLPTLENEVESWIDQKNEN